MGFVIEITGGPRIYHTGDTWILGDMALIQEIHRPTVLLLQAGGGPHNQDPKTAALAVKKYFRPKVIVPMHDGTFPPLAQTGARRCAWAPRGEELVMESEIRWVGIDAHKDTLWIALLEGAASEAIQWKIPNNEAAAKGLAGRLAGTATRYGPATKPGRPGTDCSVRSSVAASSVRWWPLRSSRRLRGTGSRPTVAML